LDLVSCSHLSHLAELLLWIFTPPEIIICVNTIVDDGTLDILMYM
jgi:hypothetical protein